MKTLRILPRTLIVIAVVGILAVAGCSSGGAPSSPSPSAPPVPSPAPSDPGAGSGTSGDPGTGVGAPSDPGVVDPGLGEPTLVVPEPGRLNPHPVGATLLEASVEDRRVLVKVTWYSGVEPCYVLDSVDVDRGGNEFVLTIIEGTSDPNAACIEIAQLKATIVDLGQLEPGEYTIRASEGEAPAVTVTVS